MLLEVSSVTETSITDNTHIWLQARVDDLMTLQVAGFLESLWTVLTFVRTFPSVLPFMDLEPPQGRIRLCAVCALKQCLFWSFPMDHQEMFLEDWPSAIALTTVFAFERFLILVSLEMPLKIGI